MRYLMVCLLLVPTLASARVFMCVDETTGKTVFTDQACNGADMREEVKVQNTNTTSGSREKPAKNVRAKVWLSDRDTRKSGRDYRSEGRESEPSHSTASVENSVSYPGS
ncbi:MAG: DUF4124 domain-containing protein [Pseudomonadota bacterium]